jgi:hypothetical protein
LQVWLFLLEFCPGSRTSCSCLPGSCYVPPTLIYSLGGES